MFVYGMFVWDGQTHLSTDIITGEMKKGKET